jgi:hypothetical protein
VDKIRNIVRKEIEKYEDEPNWKKLWQKKLPVTITSNFFWALSFFA